MKNIVIYIERDETFNTASMIASYEGARGQGTDNDSYLNLSISRAEEEALVPFWDEACQNVFTAFSEHLVTSSTDPDMTMTLSVPDNFRGGIKNVIEGSIKSFLGRYVTAKWLGMTLPEKEETYMKAATGFLDDAQTLMFSRKASPAASFGSVKVSTPKLIHNRHNEVIITR